MGCYIGFRFAKGDPIFLTYFFADDSLVFCKTSLKECHSLQRIIGVYEKASGQQLNRAKTSLFFGKNTPNDIQEEFKSRFDAQVIH